MRRLVVKLTCGMDTGADAERSAQAFTVASSAVAAGAQVSMWLTGDSVWFAVAGREPTTSLPGSPALADLRDIVLAGGDLLVCTQCANRRGISSSDLVVGARIAGSSSFVEEILSPDTQAIVY